MAEAGTTPAARLEQLTSLYERQAYVAWNVALRTALSPDRAADAARRAFRAQVAAPDESRVALDAARFAAEGAPAVDPRGIDDPALAATAHLAAPQRATLALDHLAEASGEEVAAALGIDPAAESQLRERAYVQLGDLLAVAPDSARDEYAELAWADPPEALWAAVYADLHGEVTREARAAVQPVAHPAPAKPSLRRGAVERVPRVALAAVGVLAVAGVAWAATGGGGGETEDASDRVDYGAVSDQDGGSSLSATGNPGDQGSDGPELSPEELDRLRREEIEDLKRFTRRKEDERLPVRERRQAARKVGDLVKLAEARQRAAERRELAIRRALAREREARVRERASREEDGSEDSRPARERDEPTPREQPARQETDEREEPTRRDDSGRDRDGDRDETETECLYDAGSGAYICPE